MPKDTDLIAGLYKNFNARDINGALAALHPDVAWDNDLEGGYVHGHAGVREYWTRQWAMMNSQAEPLKYHVGDDGTINVEARLTARDTYGNLMYDNIGHHAFQLKDGLIRHFERVRPRT
jgi:hypothetical protein